VVAFYAFFAPFLGTQVLEYVAIGVYTPVVSGPPVKFSFPHITKVVVP